MILPLPEACGGVDAAASPNNSEGAAEILRPNQLLQTLLVQRCNQRV